MKKVRIVHPFLFGLAPILALYVHNIQEASIMHMVWPLGLAWAGTALLWVLLYALLRDKHKAATACSLAVLLFFIHGAAFEQLFCFQIGPFILTRNRQLLAVWAMVFAAGVYGLARAPKDLSGLTRILNFTAGAMVLISFLNIAGFLFSHKSQGALGKPVFEAIQSKPGILKPDIYYIILDAYGRADTVKEFFGYDNAPFIQELTAKGFYVPAQAYSNYGGTQWSLSSSLNMSYLDPIASAAGKNARNPKIMYQWIEDNGVVELLKGLGYQYVHFRTGVSMTDHNRHADVYAVNEHRLNEFQVALLLSTMLRPWERLFVGNNFRSRILGAFDELARMPRIQGPKFVFAHIVCPHPPFVFDRDGNEVPDASMTLTGDVWQKKELYVNQMVFLNKKIMAVVEQIIAQSKTPPVIILQGDHGPHSTVARLDVRGWRHPTPPMLREMFCIFNAYYLPGKGSQVLYPAITPVNSFRAILNFYFHADLPMLEDKIYYSTDEYPYDFMDVTETVVNMEKQTGQ